jgi:hypothetical protein
MEITLENVYDFVTYQFAKNEGTESDILYIKWDNKDPNIDAFMTDDALMHNEGKYYSHLWINKLKELISWKKGNPVYIRSCFMRRGIFHIVIKKTKSELYDYEFIDENGFLRLRRFDKKTGYYGELEIVNCVYNDLLE